MKVENIERKSCLERGISQLFPQDEDEGNVQWRFSFISIHLSDPQSHSFLVFPMFLVYALLLWPVRIFMLSYNKSFYFSPLHLSILLHKSVVLKFYMKFFIQLYLKYPFLTYISHFFFLLRHFIIYNINQFNKLV